MDVHVRAVHTSMHVPLSRQRSEDSLNCHPSGTISSSLWDRVSHWMGMHQVDIMVCQPVRRFFRSPIPQGWSHMCIPPYLTFNVSSGNWTQALLLVWQALSDWVIFTAWNRPWTMTQCFADGSCKDDTIPRCFRSQKNLYLFSLCVCVLHVHVCVQMWTPITFWGQRKRLGVPLSYSLPYSHETSALTEPGAKLTASKSRDPSVSIPPSTGIAAACLAMPSCVCVFVFEILMQSQHFFILSLPFKPFRVPSPFSFNSQLFFPHGSWGFRLRFSCLWASTFVPWAVFTALHGDSFNFRKPHCKFYYIPVI